MIFRKGEFIKVVSLTAGNCLLKGDLEALNCYGIIDRVTNIDTDDKPYYCFILAPSGLKYSMFSHEEISYVDSFDADQTKVEIYHKIRKLKGY
jgi:hypothetical protein